MSKVYINNLQLIDMIIRIDLLIPDQLIRPVHSAQASLLDCLEDVLGTRREERRDASKNSKN